MASETPATLPDPIQANLERADQLEDAIPSAPTSPPPSEITREDAAALVLQIGIVTRGVDETEAAVAAWAKDQRARVDQVMAWYGPAMRLLAQKEIGASKPRRMLLPFGTLSLRKDPDRLVAMEDPDSEKKFRVFDAREGGKWTRVKLSSDSMTREELDQLVNAIPDSLLAKIKWKVEPRKEDLIEEWKKNGTIPPGFDVVVGEDRLKIDTVSKGDAQ